MQHLLVSAGMRRESCLRALTDLVSTRPSEHFGTWESQIGRYTHAYDLFIPVFEEKEIYIYIYINTHII
jgi:hypothetical protein